MNSMLRNLAGVILVVAGVAVIVLVLDRVLIRGLELGAVSVPKPADVKAVSLDQGWSRELTRDYHHTSQGTKILPRAWLLSLDEPSVDPVFSGVKLASREYLSRFGFMYDPDAKPSDLPIGFAEDDWDEKVDYVVPPITRKTRMVGLTCAACHTGRLDFDLKGNVRQGFLIEGGSAMINLGKFQEAVGQALFWTLKYRLRRFIADARQNGDDREPEEIERDLRTYITTGIASRGYAKEHKLYPVDAGFARTDALGLIGNRVFGPLNDENQSVTDAPVNFPHLWDTAWFDWVQYNASIRLPLSRNIGEALGVGAAVKPSAQVGEPYQSTVRVADLAWMEDVLGGDEPLAPWAPGSTKEVGLQPPRWEDLRQAVARAGGLADAAADAAMTINDDLRDTGLELYLKHCQRCHLPPRETLRAEWKAPKSPYWETDGRSGKKFLRLRVIDLSEIGTDPNQAVNFYRRFAVVPNPRPRERGYARSAREPDRNAIGYPRSSPAETISAEEGLYRVTSFLRAKYFRENGLFAAAKQGERRAIDRFRTLPIDPDGREVLLDDDMDIVKNTAIDDVIRANLGYKARPLDGIWATPPYFHNGSVPNLEQVLMPAAARDRWFYLGTTRFDPIKVGYKTEQFSGAFLMDTTIPGNRNTGHEFRNLTLEELESALLGPSDQVDEKHPPSLATRWGRVLGGDALGPGGQPSPKAIRERTEHVLNEVRVGSRRGIRNHKFFGVPGVLGPEFTEPERRALIAYLKSL